MVLPQTWLVVFCLSRLNRAFLILCRGQGVISVIAVIMLIVSLILLKKVNLLEGSKLIIFFCVPIFILISLYQQANIKYNHFYGISAAGNYNLFWITSSRFIDYESPKYGEIKLALKPFIRETNKNYDGDESWGVKGLNSAGNPLPQLEFLGQDWQRINTILGDVSKESIITHPLAFTYRTYWNLYDFLWNKTSLFKTIDISDLLLRNNGRKLYIDPQKALFSKTFDPLETPSLKVQQSAQSSSSTLTDFFLNMFSWLANFRFLTLGLYASFILYCFNRTKYRTFYIFLLSIVLGQILLTIIASNALYDRYFIPVEPLSIPIILGTLADFLKFSWPKKVKTTILFFILPLFVLIFFKTILFFLPPYSIIDKPILGLSEVITVSHQQQAIGITFAVIFSIIITILCNNFLQTLCLKYERNLS